MSRFSYRILKITMKQGLIVTFLLVLCNGVLLHKSPYVKPDELIGSSLADDDTYLPQDQNIFIQEIFDKYGSAGIISFEGFEHLLENLGLGRLAFDKDHSVSVHRVNGTFKEVHDALELHHHHHYDTASTKDQHRTQRSLDRNNHNNDDSSSSYDLDTPEVPSVHVTRSSALKRCLSPQEILLTFGLDPHHAVVISPQKFLNLCPAIVYELDQRACFQKESLAEEARPNAVTQYSAWLYASLSVLAISLVGLLGVAVVPLVKKAFYQQFLHFLVALAVGTLCGDALLHLLPHALMSSDGSTGHTTSVLRAAVAFLSLTFFFVVEAVIRCVSAMNMSKKLDPKRSREKEENSIVELGPMMTESINPSHGHQHYDGDGQVSSVAWMVIMGDGLHNLTDGLAIGAAFAGDTVAGFATTMAVFCHELPHEIGDFAVLLNSGMSVRRALAYNVFSSVLSFTGMAFGVWIGDHGEAALWIYAVTAGTFLYISLADLIPEMNSNGDGSAKTPVDVLLQIAGIMTGGGIMLAIALYEDDLHAMFN